MSTAILYTAEHYSEDENIFAFLPPSPATADPRRGADRPAVAQPAGDSQQQCVRPTTTVATNISFPSITLDLIPTTAMSSNEVRESLPSREGSDIEPGSRPITRVRGESIVSMSRRTAGDAELYASEDMDRPVLEDVQVKAPPSRMGSIE